VTAGGAATRQNGHGGVGRQQGEEAKGAEGGAVSHDGSLHSSSGDTEEVGSSFSVVSETILGLVTGKYKLPDLGFLSTLPDGKATFVT